MNNIKKHATLVVSSCDKYADAWYPYFELIKKYWPNHPEKVALITETKKYACDGLDIQVYNAKSETQTWSERLYNCLNSIETEYIIFSLEDFFLLDFVKEEQLEKCYDWMEENPNIAVCRLFSSENKKLIQTQQYEDFRIADQSIAFRLDTQMALWRRETLMSFIDLKETPWQFEEIGTQRAKNTDKTFLWHYCENVDDISKHVVPYRTKPKYGYGIAWGNWLWNNKKWFLENEIKGVKYHRLGQLSKRASFNRMNHLYNKNKTPIEKIIFPFWIMIIRLKKLKQNIFTLGIKKGLKEKVK